MTDDSLLGMFRRCLSAEYIHTSEDGDYCIETDVKTLTLYLLFEWSDGGQDWSNNLDFPVTPYRHMGEKWYCHRGFLRVWRGIRDEVEEQVASTVLRNPGIREIRCIGYSHGAALALLATEDMVYRFGEKRVRGYGFGCPRVIWGRLPGAVSERLEVFTVVRNVPDLVTHLPPAAFGFRHVGTLIEVGKGNGYSPVDAHRPEAYIRSLTEYENGSYPPSTK